VTADPRELLRGLSPAERAEVEALVDADREIWRPLPGPQTLAVESEADVVGYGGAGGGGKSDLVCGLATTRHQRAIIFRETGTELVGIRGRLREMLGEGSHLQAVTGEAADYNGRDAAFSFVRPDGVACEVELGAFPDLGDEQKFRGRPHDLLAFDEASNMREQQVRFLFAWNRSTDPEQRVRAVLTFNPPDRPEGRWILQFFAPWLDPKHPKPALPGELRWFATVAGVDIEVPDARPFVLGPDGRSRHYDFDPARYQPEDVIRPQSRTFIPSRVTDNPFLAGTGYMRVLQALPEPLRSQMLYGDFRAGLKDDAFQVIPTAWVEAAMARWRKPAKLPPMDTLGVDIAMGGDDEHVIIARHGWWFAEPIAHPGHAVPDGARSAAHVVAALRDEAVIHLDLFGVGAMTYGFLMGLQLQVIGVQFGELVPNATDLTGRMQFANLRSLLWWRMREALDPNRNTGIMLPPHQRLLADLTAPKWSLPGQTIKVQSRDDIIKTLGRSPDYATAAILALMVTPKRRKVLELPAGYPHVTRADRRPESRAGHDPYSVLDP
jgi:hypothetical protein